MERNAMRAAMLPGRNPETANAFRRYIDDLLAPRDPSRQYGMLLPISSDPNVPDSAQFDLRGGVTGDILGMLGAGGRAMRGEEYNPMDITTGLMNVATPSLASRPSASTARIFGGESAEGMQNMFRRARDFFQRRYNPEIVHHNTGVFRAPEGRLMFEIDDSAARLRPENLRRLGPESYSIPAFRTSKGPAKLGEVEPFPNLTVEDVLHHPELYSRYPQIAKTPVGPTGFNFDILGAYSPSDNKIFLRGGKLEEMRSTLLHEIQHNVQNIEKFAQGGNPQQFLASNHTQVRQENDQLLQGLRDVFKTDGIDFNIFTLRGAMEAEEAGKKLYRFQREALDAVKNHPLWDDLKLAISNDARLAAAENEAFDRYQGLIGERMARTVQERRDMPAAERRAAIPRIVD